MMGGKRVLAIVPARGGSKGLSRKNLADLGGQPLVAWPVIVARNTPEIDRVIVSTEDAEIASVAAIHGAEIDERPRCLASDTAGVYDVLMELRDRLRRTGETAEIVVVMEPASPFRSPEIVRRCLALVAEGGFDSAATFHPCRSHPHRAWRLRDGRVEPFVKLANPWVRRQALPPAVELSGEVYVFYLDQLSTQSRSFLPGASAPVVLSSEHSIDIDSAVDLEIARSMFDASELAGLA